MSPITPPLVYPVDPCPHGVDLKFASCTQCEQPVRIDQDTFGARGNCQSACLAMLLDLDLASVPNFSLHDRDEDCFNAQREWLHKRGWTIITISYTPGFMYGYWIAGGPSARGLHHACVYLDEQLWHDPHPDRSGLLKVTEADLLYPLRTWQVR